MIATIPFHELPSWGERQKRGELRMFGLTVLKGEYKVDYENLGSVAELADASPAGNDRSESGPVVGQDAGSSPAASTIFNPGSGESVIAGVSRDPVETKKAILGQPLKLCPACQTKHSEDAECDMEGIASRFEKIAADARFERQRYAMNKKAKQATENENPF